MNFVETTWEEVRKEYGIHLYARSQKYPKLFASFIASKMDVAEIIFSNTDKRYADSKDRTWVSKMNINRAIKRYGYEDMIGVYGTKDTTDGKLFLYRKDREDLPAELKND